jgi:hypothetical protein
VKTPGTGVTHPNYIPFRCGATVYSDDPNDQGWTQVPDYFVGRRHVYISYKETSLVSTVRYPEITFTYAPMNISVITASANEGGTLTPNGHISVNNGQSQTFVFTPNTGYYVSKVLIDGQNNPDAASAGSYTFENVTTAHTIKVEFAIYKYTLSASVNGGGTIFPSGPIIVNYGATQSYTITASNDYRIKNLVIDGVVKTDAADESVFIYTFTNITADHTIVANFSPLGVSENNLSNVNVFSHLGNVYIKNETNIALKSVEISDMAGRVVYRGNITNPETIIPLQAANGIYNVKLISQDNTVLHTKIVSLK